MDEEKVRLLIQVAVRDAVDAAVGRMNETLPATVAKAMAAEFDRLELKPSHFEWLKARFEVERDTWSHGRKVLIGLALAAILTFMGVAAYREFLERVVIYSEQHRNGVAERPAGQR